jgi:hypothetical protein
MSKFEKGQSGNPAGRPVGSGDRQFIRTDFWLGRYWESIAKLDEEKKQSKIEFVLEKFFSKIQVLTASPEDSKSNADNALEELKRAEAYGITHNGTNGAPHVEPGSNGAHVETGPVEGQAPA